MGRSKKAIPIRPQPKERENPMEPIKIRSQLSINDIVNEYIYNIKAKFKANREKKEIVKVYIAEANRIINALKSHSIDYKDIEKMTNLFNIPNIPQKKTIVRKLVSAYKKHLTFKDYENVMYSYSKEHEDEVVRFNQIVRILKEEDIKKFNNEA